MGKYILNAKQNETSGLICLFRSQGKLGQVVNNGRLLTHGSDCLNRQKSQADFKGRGQRKRLQVFLDLSQQRSLAHKY